MKEELPPEGPPRFEIRVLPDPEEAAGAAAREVVAACADGLADHGAFRPAFSGGSTPRLLFDALASAPFRALVDWNRARIFFVDERCVPPDDARSNYRLAKEHLLDPLRVPAENAFRMRGEEDPHGAALAYEEALKGEFGAVGFPRFDFVLLGLGPDGHTASLFPGTRALEERERWVVENSVPKLAEWRLTLTLPVLNAARRAVFLVVGEEKRDAVASVLRMAQGSPMLPASLVRLERGSLVWIVDEAAASGLGTDL
ncbi:MAG TPA: 6-phosphogluconolactonase [Thermoanaerobaculia bacterium]